MTDKAKPFPPRASMSTPELIARLRSCTTSIFGEWEAADRLASVPVLEARVAELEGALRELFEARDAYNQMAGLARNEAWERCVAAERDALAALGQKGA